MEPAALPCHRATASLPSSAMKNAMILLFHLLTVIAGLLRPGGGRAPTPARFATPGRQILSSSSRFTSGIPTPIPSHASALRPNLEHVARGAESRNFSFSDFWGARAKPREHVGSYQKTQEPSPVCVASFPISRDRSVSVRDRVGFGLGSSGTNLLYVLGFNNVSGNINSNIRVIRCFMFRDRLG